MDLGLHKCSEQSSLCCYDIPELTRWNWRTEWRLEGWEAVGIGSTGKGFFFKALFL